MSKLILVEDDEDDIYFFKNACRREAVEVEIVILNDGSELLDYIDANNCTSDLIMLDLNMPKVGGIEVLTRLKSSGLVYPLNVIVYTTSARKTDVEQAYRLGAKSFIQKPNSQEQLNFLIRSVYVYWFEFNLLLRKPQV
ncbi:response regulator [Thalassotalea marina]|uniref:Response regulator n=1 Tax=Thalassotalea marina TaxID=1673741 RepID=A0A919BLM8_9GAMM|nr:response regulator [Thalassotalea marina]GHF98447.1 response regulator [Thalassotalea marina]